MKLPAGTGSQTISCDIKRVIYDTAIKNVKNSSTMLQQLIL